LKLRFSSVEVNG